MVNVVDIAHSGTKIGTLRSASYRMSDLHAVGQDQAAPYWQEFQRQLSGSVIPEHISDVYLVHDAVVDGPGLVFDRDLNLIRQSIRQTTTAEIDSFNYGVVDWHMKGQIPSHSGKTLLCEKAGVGNYGHWMVEMLPIVQAFITELTSKQYSLRMPIGPARMTAVMFDSLNLLGVPHSQVKMRRAGPERYERLLFVDNFTDHGNRYSPIAVESFDAIKRNFETAGSGKIWVTRERTQRKLVCEAELCAELTKRGWRIVDPATMRLHDQVTAFASAREIAGVAGAGLTNIGFSEAGTKVTAFLPSLMPDLFYWSLASMKGQAYREIRCPVIAGSDGGNWDGVLDVSLSRVLDLLDG
ncbi:glycosyltransferase family 61 protein [Acidisoma cellulosilytica]|uniref:Glycosyltransferase family 61 protein n=1 Tax=Acidisoma cellulosilyticum TaxID=2802395 RepID=A0A963Z5V6_9PROT|nr:glycosyltransferase family 61 protein [Acidisoma cellulosilyticum]MCB8883465.1 glycosyltransferase family 61 protein [Acidisoma cellulosilyticum]